MMKQYTVSIRYKEHIPNEIVNLDAEEFAALVANLQSASHWVILPNKAVRWDLIDIIKLGNAEEGEDE